MKYYYKKINKVIYGNNGFNKKINIKIYLYKRTITIIIKMNFYKKPLLLKN